MMKRRVLILLVLALAMVFTVNAQEGLIEPIGEPENPNINISFPPPVYVVRDRVEVRGTANLSSMSNYFIEFRPLEVEPLVPETTEGTPIADQPWFPATLPSASPIQDDILGEWNTTTAPDGLYEIRLTVNITGNDPQFFRVSPIRIENNPPDFVEIPTIPQATPTPTTADQGPRPTLAPSPTAISTNPQVTALVDSNVRQGDSVSYDTVGALLSGETAPILGISTNNGWYYIQLSSGRRGFVSPSIVRTEGNLANLSQINPPATPTPPATNTPVAVSNIVINGSALSPSTPTCATAFNVQVDVLNNGSGNTGQPITVTVTDRHVASGTQTTSNQTTVPALAPGQNFLVLIPLTVSVYYAEEHEITIRVDSGNVVPETNEGDNTRTRTYTLAQGTCG